MIEMLLVQVGDASAEMNMGGMFQGFEQGPNRQKFISNELNPFRISLSFQFWVLVRN